MSKRKLLWLGALGAIVAIAFAQSMTVRGAVGHGAAGAPDAGRPNAHFNFHVAQFTYNDQTRVRGQFNFSFRGERLVEISMHEVARFGANMDTGVAEFSGPAIAVIRTPNGVRRERGIAFVRVQDNRGPGQSEGDPDTIAVGFRLRPDADPIFTYRGVVKVGDIKVFERTGSR